MSVWWMTSSILCSRDRTGWMTDLLISLYVRMWDRILSITSNLFSMVLCSMCTILRSSIKGGDYSIYGLVLHAMTTTFYYFNIGFFFFYSKCFVPTLLQICYDIHPSLLISAIDWFYYKWYITDLLLVLHDAVAPCQNATPKYTLTLDIYFLQF